MGIKKIVYEELNVPGLIKRSLDELLEPALQKVVDDSSNPLDNVAKEALYPVLSKELNALVEKEYKKLLSEDAE